MRCVFVVVASERKNQNRLIFWVQILGDSKREKRRRWETTTTSSWLFLLTQREMEEDRPPSGSGGGIPPEKGGYEDGLNNDGGAGSSSAAAAAANAETAQAAADNDEPQALFDLNSGAAVVFAAVMILLHLFKGEFFLYAFAAGGQRTGREKVSSFPRRHTGLLGGTKTSAHSFLGSLFPPSSPNTKTPIEQTPSSPGALAERKENIAKL